MLTTINRFVDTMLEEENKFNNIQKEISGKEQLIEGILNSFKDSQKKLIQQVEQSALAQSDTLVKEILNDTTVKLDSKISAADHHIKEGLKGMTFIENFEKTFTVSVFGKVKAGKSYLGNFVMGQTLKANNIPSSYDKLKEIPVTVYDKGKLSKNSKLSTAEKSEDGFEVNMNEATSTIQYFSIGGITWFDTPGIGSITVENEELAKEYIKNSDLVVYATISDAAGTRQDFEEMKALYDMGKPIVLLLTQSDTTDFDEDDDGNEIETLVAKSEEDRKAIANHMKETLKENGISEILNLAELMHVSVLLANEGVKDKNPSLMKESNMNTFLEKLISITKNDAADMKRKTPMQRLNKTIHDIINQLSTVESEISDYFKELDNKAEELKQQEQVVLQTVKAEVNQKVKAKLQELGKQVKSDGATISGRALQEIVNQLVNETITSVCAKELAHHLDKISKIDLPEESVGELEMKKGSIEHTRKESYRTSRDPKGFFEHVGSIFGKEYYSYSSRTVTETSSFDIGINEAEIHKNIMKQLNTVFEQQVSSLFSGIFDNYYTPIKQLEKDIATELKKTIKTLEGLLQ